MKQFVIIILALTVTIGSPNLHAAKFSLDDDLYHIVDCTKIRSCTLKSYKPILPKDEKTGLPKDQIINAQHLKRRGGSSLFEAQSRIESLNVVIYFYPEREQLDIKKRWFEKVAEFSCELTVENIYICKDRVTFG